MICLAAASEGNSTYEFAVSDPSGLLARIGRIVGQGGDTLEVSFREQAQDL